MEFKWRQKVKRDAQALSDLLKPSRLFEHEQPDNQDQTAPLTQTGIPT